MKLLPALLLAGCVQWPPEGWRQFVTPCGVTVYQREDSPITQEDVVEMELRVTHYLNAFEGHACAKLRGTVAHELDGDMTENPPGRLAAGWAECWNSRLFYHRGEPPVPHPWDTALWHEMIHIVQGCYRADTPPDDPDHPHWTERGYHYLPTRLGLP